MIDCLNEDMVNITEEEVVKELLHFFVKAAQAWCSFPEISLQYFYSKGAFPLRSYISTMVTSKFIFHFMLCFRK